MYSYDRRKIAAGNLGTLGVSLEQITSAVQRSLGLESTSVNIMFGAVESGERELAVPFQVMGAGKDVQGRVVFRILEANSRMWNGPAILLEGTVEV